MIYPGDIVSLSYQDGQPVLNIDRGTGQVVSGRNVKLSPTIRSSDNAVAIPTIPIDAIQPFLERPIVLDENEMDQWSYVVSSYDQHLIATTGNTIYIRGIAEDSDVVRYSIYRKGPAYVNPKKAGEDKGEILGYEAIYVGEAVLQKKGDPASAIVTIVDREILIGDRLIAQSDKDISTEFIPRSPDSEMEGNILSVVDGVSQIGQYQIVVLNLGEEQGLEAGNVLGVYQSGYVVQDKIVLNTPEAAEEKKDYPDNAGGTVSKISDAFGEIVDAVTFDYITNKQGKSEDITLPEEYVGVIMVFRTFSKVSYALVMKTQGPVHVFDTVRSL